MKLSLTLFKKQWAFFLIGLLIIALNLALTVQKYDYLLYLAYVIVGLLTLYFLVFDKKKLVFITVFLIPLSIPIKIGGGSSVSLPSEILVAILGLYIIFKAIIKTEIQKSLLFHPITILLFLDLLWMLVCSFFSSIPEFSYKRTLVRLLYITVFYFVTAEVFKSEKNIYRLFIAYLLGMMYPIINSMLYHVNFGFMARGSYEMTKPFFNDHTIYGACLVFFVPLLFMMVINRKLLYIRGNTAVGLYILTAFISLAAFLSYSRAAWLGLIVSLIFSLLVFLKIRFFWIILFLTVGATYITYNIDTIMADAKRSDAKSNSKELTEHAASVANIQSDASNTERINRWKCAVRMFYERPVLGYGPGTYQYNYGKFQVRAEMTRISTYTGNRGHAHSEYLTYLSESGLPCFILFALLVLYSVFLGMQIIYSSQKVLFRRLALSILMGLITYYVHGVFNAFMDIDKMAMPVLAALAALVTLDIKNKSESRKVSHQEELNLKKSGDKHIEIK